MTTRGAIVLGGDGVPQQLQGGDTLKLPGPASMVSLQVTGVQDPTSGSGVEITYYSNLKAGFIQAYDRDTPAWRPLNLQGATVSFAPQVGGITMGATTTPSVDNTYSIGSAALRWSSVYAATGSINTSDARAKQQIGAIPDAWLDAWGDVAWVRYKFNDAVTDKGDAGARWHIGLVAQAVRDAFANRGIDALTIGLLCHDTWTATPAVPEQRDESGTLMVAAQPAVPAGDRWGVRYGECLAMEAAWGRRDSVHAAQSIATLTSQLAALQAKLKP